MRVLFDTNILVHREDDDVVPEDLRDLERYLNEQSHCILVHPLSEQELRNDSDENRRERNTSRVETYATLGFPAYPGDDEEFRRLIPKSSSPNNQVDNALLYAVYEDLADFLITQDNGIHRKALTLGVEERVFTIEDAQDYFKPDKKAVRGPHNIKRTTVGELDVDDPIFDSLKDDYGEFERWAHSKSDRTAWVTYNTDGTLGAVLILKPNEVEKIGRHQKLQ